MDIYRSIESLNPLRKSILTIGSYDGLHRGHQAIVNKVVTTSRTLNLKSVVITFDPHPKQVLTTTYGNKFETLISIDKKIELLEKMGVDVTLIIPFDKTFSKTTAEEFINNVIINYFHPSKIFIGYDHHFGYNREGNANSLMEYEHRGQFRVEKVHSIKDQEEIISSSHIRDLIQDGYVRRASFELGWVFGFKATVVHGVGRGHRLRYPTANFIPENPTQLLPKNGVYFTRGLVNNKCLYGMCNIGYRPTFGEGNFVLEVHFFEEPPKELYGEIIEVQFLERIRDEQKFKSPVELKKQLEKDKEYCLSRLEIYTEEEKCH